MVATEDDLKLTRLKYRFNFRCNLLAGVANLAHILQFLALFRKNLRTLEAQVAEIAHRISESRDWLRQTRDTQRSRTDVRAGHARAVAEWHAENRNRLFYFRTHFRKSVSFRSPISTEVNVQPAATAAALMWKERSQQASQRGEIPCLNQ